MDNSIQYKDREEVRDGGVIGYRTQSRGRIYHVLQLVSRYTYNKLISTKSRDIGAKSSITEHN